MKHLYAVALTLWMYCSAIFYPADQLSGPIRWVVEVNPLYLFIRVLRSALYQKKIVLAAVSFGALGALAGTAFTVTLPAGVLTAVLLVIMAFTSVSMLRKRA